MQKYPFDIASIREVYRQEILKILKKQDYETSKIIKFIETTHPKLCDDKIKCICGNKETDRPEWHHQVRWALQDLKYQDKITFDKENRRYSII